MTSFDQRLTEIVEKALHRTAPSRDDLLWLLSSSDADTLAIVAAVSQVRRRFFGNRIKLNFLLNIKSGICSEDCSYCAQSRVSVAAIPTYTMVDQETFVSAAYRARELGATRLCLVASGRGPTNRELDRLTKGIKAIKAGDPAIEICASLGMLRDGQAQRLVDAGACAYNHNLNTSEGFYDQICSTHSFGNRATNVAAAREGGLSPCSGVLVGMGETDDDIVDVGYALRDLAPDSVPVNFLIPIPGTALAGASNLTPLRCLRILAAYRCLFPDTELRIAGGREVHLRSLQVLGLHLANSIFIGDYLTTKGQASQADLDMIVDGGFVIEGGAGPSAPHVRPDDVRLKQAALE